MNPLTILNKLEARSLEVDALGEDQLIEVVEAALSDEAWRASNLDLTKKLILRVEDVAASSKPVALTFSPQEETDIQKVISLCKGLIKKLDLSQLGFLGVDLPNIQELKNLEELSLVGWEELEKLPDLTEFKHLKKMDLGGCKSLKDFSFLKELKELEVLDLTDCSITDFSFLKELKHLKVLDLSGCRIKTFPDLGECKNLESVTLWGSQVSTPLCFKNLKSINFENSNIVFTEEEWKEFKRDNPDCLVKINEKTIEPFVKAILGVELEGKKGLIPYSLAKKMAEYFFLHQVREREGYTYYNKEMSGLPFSFEVQDKRIIILLKQEFKKGHQLLLNLPHFCKRGDSKKVTIGLDITDGVPCAYLSLNLSLEERLKGAFGKEQLAKELDYLKKYGGVEFLTRGSHKAKRGGKGKVKGDEIETFTMFLAKGTGNDLKALGLNEKEIRVCFFDISLALQKMHHDGVIHRDIKPLNILVGKDHRAKINDFGLSGPEFIDGGPLLFFSPEKVERKRTPALDEEKSDDLFALALTIVDMVSNMEGWSKFYFLNYNKENPRLGIEMALNDFKKALAENKSEDSDEKRVYECVLDILNNYNKPSYTIDNVVNFLSSS